MDRHLVSEAEYAVEAANHADFVNSVLGLVTFTLSLTALQFPNPSKIAFLSLVVLIPLYIQTIILFPASLKALRELKRQESGNQELIEIISKLEKKHHGWRAIPRHAILILSLIVYAGVLFSDTFPCMLWFKL